MGLNTWVLVVAVASPFDARGYLETKSDGQGAVAAALTSRAIYRLGGRRYLRFDSADGGVLVPADSDTAPSVKPELALCPQHLSLIREALMIRKDLPIDPPTRFLEPQLQSLIILCKEGKIRGPVRTELTPDGAILEIGERSP